MTTTNSETKVRVGSGKTWTVRMTGDVCEIVDEHGNDRHRSTTHAMTAAHLAVALADLGRVGGQT